MEKAERGLPAPRPLGVRSSAGGAQSRTDPGGAWEEEKGPAGLPGGSSKPQLLSAPSPDFYCSVSSGGEGPGLEKGQSSRNDRAVLQPGSVLHVGAVPSESTPTDVASGLQAAGKGARARAQGLYVNGDSGGVRGDGSGAAGRARLGPGGRSWLSGIDGDDLAATTADQHHPVQVLGEDLEELHV